MRASWEVRGGKEEYRGRKKCGNTIHIQGISKQTLDICLTKGTNGNVITKPLRLRHCCPGQVKIIVHNYTHSKNRTGLAICMHAVIISEAYRVYTQTADETYCCL